MHDDCLTGYAVDPSADAIEEGITLLGDKEAAESTKGLVTCLHVYIHHHHKILS